MTSDVTQPRAITSRASLGDLSRIGASLMASVVLLDEVADDGDETSAAEARLDSITQTKEGPKASLASMLTEHAVFPGIL